MRQAGKGHGPERHASPKRSDRPCTKASGPQNRQHRPRNAEKGRLVDRYYKEQLKMLREGANAFALQHPAIAPMLLTQGGDPDVERILEGTAYLCGKIHERLDQTAPDLVQSLLRLVFPQAILPIPSTTLIRFTLQPGFAEPLDVEKGTQVASNPVDGVSCIYSTTHDLRVLPLEIVSIRHDMQRARNRVEVTFKSRAPLRTFLGDGLLLHLSGEYAAASQRLLALLTELDHMDIVLGTGRRTLPASCVSYPTLPLDDIRLPAGRRTNRSYMELLRYFHFPEQLLFVRISQLDQLSFSESLNEFRLIFCFRNNADLPEFPEGSLTLNVVPAANVFRVPADPLVIDHTQEEYLIHPQDGERRFLEIFSIGTVSARMPGGRILPCMPYEAYHSDNKGLLYSVRFRSSEKEGRTEHLLMPLYRFGSGSLEKYTLSMELICCNHTLPGSLRMGDICRPTDSSPAQASFTNIIAPAPMLPRPQNESLQWRFLSHLNTNLLSLASADALRSLLELYIPETAAAPELAAADMRRCMSIKQFSSQGEEHLFRGRLLRGRALYLELAPFGFVSDGDMYLFTNALDRFFTEFTSINNYSRLILSIAGTGKLREWPPRLGDKQLI